MYLSNERIRQLLRLKTDANIADEIAVRQTEVIRKAYNYLTDPAAQNHLIYLADEVGLGKTYMALGIALLLRHHAPNPLAYQDVVIVPKKNLQKKWHEALQGFLNHNYLDEPQKKILKPLFEDLEILKETLQPIDAQFSIFRMSSFSVNSERAKGKLEEYAQTCPLALQIVDNQYFKDITFEKQDVLFAYWLNATHARPIDCLIVDEAHNYKHGLKDGENASLRNRLTAYYLGTVKDEALLEMFPCLKGNVHFPLAKKIICLSATPQDRDLFEVKLQLDCFTSQHPLVNTKPADLKDLNLLRPFLIRGNLFYQLAGAKKSRHECRLEHRKGNVIKEEEAKRLEVENDFMGAFWQLIQYQSIKHLAVKNNASFEIGMLAGFETYRLDVDSKKNKDEYYEVADKKNESEDKAVIQGIISAYKEIFQEYPPHPKQTRLQAAVLEQLKSQDKSLIFVRRVNTVTELTTCLLRSYEQYISELLHFKGKKYKIYNQCSNKILAAYNLHNKKDELNHFFSKKLIPALNKHSFFQTEFMDLTEQLNFCFFAYSKLPDVKELQDRYKSLKNIALHINDTFKKRLNDQKLRYKKAKQEDDAALGESDTTYFFNVYCKRGNQGMNFRKTIFKENVFIRNFLPQLLTTICKNEYETWKNRKRYQADDRAILDTILKGVFEHGTGLLPAFIAYNTEKEQFTVHLLALLGEIAPFQYVQQEVKTILQDFDLIVSINFSHRKLDEIEKIFKKLSPIIGRTGKSENRSEAAAQFRLPGFPYVLVATDIFREGEDLHTYCQNVYHYGIAWNPSSMEQRTGRIDRINSLSYRKLTDKTKTQDDPFKDSVHVFYPYLQHSIEVNQVSNLFGRMNQFMENFNEIDEKKRPDILVSINEVVTEDTILPPPILKCGRFEIDSFVDRKTSNAF